jgi:NodT family efflux transporter outer membrane factor (OMF) lipoprotein
MVFLCKKDRNNRKTKFLSSRNAVVVRISWFRLWLKSCIPQPLHRDGLPGEAVVESVIYKVCCLSQHCFQGCCSVIVIVMIFLLTGCGVTPSREALPIEPPAQFQAEGGELPVGEKWWQAFADPYLDILMAQALTGNFSLRAAWARLRQAEAIVQRERASTFPTLNMEGNVTYEDGRSRRDATTRQLGLFAAYELDLWGRIKATSEAAKLDAKASKADLRTAAISLSATITNTWYQYVEQRAQIRLIDRQLETNRQLLKLIEVRFRTGQVKASDVFRQRQLLAQTEGEYAQAQTQLLTLDHQLAILLGVAPGTLSLPEDVALPKLAPLPATGVPADLLRRRPDLQAALLRLRAADARAAAAVSAQYPRLDLSAALTTPGGGGGVFDGWLGNIVAQLSAPLFDGGQRKAEAARTQAYAQELLNDYAQVLLEALGEVENALVAESGQRRVLASIDARLQALVAVAGQERQRYFQGDADYLSVLDALRSRQTLERQQLSAQRTLITDRIALVTALAGGWSMTSEDKPR